MILFMRRSSMRGFNVEQRRVFRVPGGHRAGPGPGRGRAGSFAAGAAARRSAAPGAASPARAAGLIAAAAGRRIAGVGAVARFRRYGGRRRLDRLPLGHHAARRHGLTRLGEGSVGCNDPLSMHCEGSAHRVDGLTRSGLDNGLRRCGLIGADGGGRTRTGKARGILSPLRLPVPPRPRTRER
jgi:hypothetical protein